jgi:two-component system phosphate regulon sensor histidine kinase PhoR
VLAVLGGALGFIEGPGIGAAFVAGAVLLLWLRDQRYLSKLEAWIEVDRKSALPPASGAWDDLFAKLYRQARESERQNEALTEALVSFRRAAQALPDGVVMLSDLNQILWCNGQAEQHFNLKLEIDGGQSVTNLLRAPDFQSYLEGRDWEQPVQLRMRSDSQTNVRTLSVQLVEYGNAQRLLLSRDITKIERLETMRRDFVANVSHELKTPLTVLAGFLETIREVKLPARQQEHYLALMSEQAERMQRLVADLLTLSALEADRAPSNDTIDMTALLARIEAAATELSKGRHTLSFEVDPALHLLGSETEIASALTNLVTNAIRYTPEGGQISVTWSKIEAADGSHAQFVVSDTGIGIESHHLPRLTERFYRVDRGRSRGSGGTGLGLAIVKHVLTRHQGRLEITSSVGAGSRFVALFPKPRMLAAVALGLRESERRDAA